MCIASHEVTVKDAKDRFMGDDEKVALLSFELQNYWFKADGKVVIGLFVNSASLVSLVD